MKDYLSVNKSHRNSELNIANLSEAMKIPRHRLTQVINEGLGVNFYTLINRLRIGEVLSRISENDSGDSILRIAFESGFQSKSTFNRVFRHMMGVSPREYRGKPPMENMSQPSGWDAIPLSKP
ncbi:MAG: AraC family transcriptional regulator [Spirochaetia bacterium]|nr:AraC family transcriptional regulator [Spirochaetia bacterium]